MKDVAIIGGGLAGLISAIYLSSKGLDVLLIEKKKYPFHKVCGEYISNEVIPFLKSLDIFPDHLQPSKITKLLLSAPSGRVLEAELDLGGFGISRYAFDHFLMEKAKVAGADILEATTVNEVAFENDSFHLKLNKGKPINAKVAIGSYGKRANLDRVMNRNFFYEDSPYVGIKYHMQLDFPEDLIALHNFRNGYCGVVKIEDEKYNVCYLVRRDELKRFGDIDTMEGQLLSLNPHLKEIFHSGIRLNEKPEVINEISFADKSLIEDHVLMCGDAAGMITPLCGNGMAMAIHGAKILSTNIMRYFDKGISRENLEMNYRSEWKNMFSRRMKNGRLIQYLFGKKFISEAAVSCMKYLPAVTEQVISRTHGKEFSL